LFRAFFNSSPHGGGFFSFFKNVFGNFFFFFFPQKFLFVFFFFVLREMSLFLCFFVLEGGCFVSQKHPLGGGTFRVVAGFSFFLRRVSWGSKNKPPLQKFFRGGGVFLFLFPQYCVFFFFVFLFYCFFYVFFFFFFFLLFFT